MNDYMPNIDKPKQVRKIPPTHKSVSGVYPFRRKTSIQYESTLERDFLIRKEFCNEVLDIIPQPVEISYEGINGKIIPYTPDFLVYYKLADRGHWNYPKPELVEVKPKKELMKNLGIWKTKWKAAVNYSKAQGWVFRIYDDFRIRTQALENIRFLQRYKRMQFPEQENNIIIESIKQMGSAPFHYILSRHFIGPRDTAGGIAQVWHLLATRQIDCDINLPLNNNTELWIPSYD